MDRVLSVKEAAEVLNTSKDRVYELHRAGLLRGLQIGHLGFREKSIDEFLEKWDGYNLKDLNNIQPLLAE